MFLLQNDTHTQWFVCSYVGCTHGRPLMADHSLMGDTLVS